MEYFERFLWNSHGWDYFGLFCFILYFLFVFCSGLKQARFFRGGFKAAFLTEFWASFVFCMFSVTVVFWHIDLVYSRNAGVYKNFLVYYPSQLEGMDPISDYEDFNEFVNKLADKALEDKLKTVNRSDSHPFLGSAKYFQQFLLGKRSCELVVCRDCARYCVERFGKKYGRYCVYTRYKNGKAHIEYLTFIKNKKGRAAWFLLSWNCFDLRLSKKGESLADFLRRVKSARVIENYFIILY